MPACHRRRLGTVLLEWVWGVIGDDGRDLRQIEVVAVAGASGPREVRLQGAHGPQTWRYEAYGVNPAYDEIEGVPCYPDLASLPRRPDLVITWSSRGHGRW